MVNIEELKKHLNIEFDDDNDYLSLLEMAAVRTLKNYCQSDFSTLEDDDLNVIVHCVKILVANLYANRESIAYSSIVEVPYSFEYLLQPYVRYIKR